MEVVTVINQIDLQSADVDRVMEEIDRDLGLDPFRLDPGLGQARHRASTSC